MWRYSWDLFQLTVILKRLNKQCLSFLSNIHTQKYLNFTHRIFCGKRKSYFSAEMTSTLGLIDGTRFIWDSLFLSWLLSFRCGSGDRVWSPTVSEDGKTSPYTEPDSQVTTVYSGFTEAEVTDVSLDLNSHPLRCCQDWSAWISYAAKYNYLDSYSCKIIFCPSFCQGRKMKIVHYPWTLAAFAVEKKPKAWIRAVAKCFAGESVKKTHQHQSCLLYSKCRL